MGQFPTGVSVKFNPALTPVPKWFINGLEAVKKAPSAVNRQPVKFIYKEGAVQAFVEDSYKFDLVDLGIAKAHFSIATGGSFEIGNYGKFIAAT